MCTGCMSSTPSLHIPKTRSQNAHMKHEFVSLLLSYFANNSSGEKKEGRNKHKDREVSRFRPAGCPVLGKWVRG